MSESSLFDLPPAAPAAPAQPATNEFAIQPGASPPRSLYRKYRPGTFAEDDLVGQEHVVNTLRNAIALNRIAHAYLFCGPRGTGKTTTARLLAKAVNCLAPDPMRRPCNVCDACVAINRGATTDVIEVDAASNRGIDDIRDLRERVKYAPSQLRTKFYIIDEAHQITGAAANAFLKTLEEPPSHTRFVLATTDPEELLPTIVSRCQRFDFRRISLDAMVSRLRTVAEAERIDVEDGALGVIARHATGSLRDALGILDQVAVYRERADSEQTTVTAELVRTVLGVSRNERVENLVGALADRDASAALRSVNDAFEAGEDIRQLARQLVQYLRSLLLLRAGGHADVDDRAREYAGRFELARLADLARLFADIDYRIKRASLVQLPLELALVEGCTESTAPTIPAVVVAATPATVHQPLIDTRPTTSLRERVRGTSTSPPETSTPVPAPRMPSEPPTPIVANSAPITANGKSAPTLASADGTLAIDTIVDLWSRIRQDVKAVNRRVEALLQQVDPVHVSGETVILTSPYEFHRTRLNSDEVRRTVEDVISRLVSRQVLISCLSRDEVAALTANVGSTQAGAEPSLEKTDALDSGSFDATPTSAASSSSTVEDDERRLQAAKNIFDAEEVDG
ncbi:MAG: DNA polymerase III subunit gamma/tau [Chloroflexia bacterium]|nr:DNA polymerase III subunit gamma/tau [Chloroflexia bacterium]